MRPAILTSFLSATLFVSWCEAQPKIAPKPAPSPRVSASQTAYQTRVNTINNEMEPLLMEVLVDFDQMQRAAAASISRTRRRVGAPDPEEQMKTLRVSLLSNVVKLRPNLKRLRGISPVPYSLKKADNDVIDGAIEMEQGLNALAIYVEHPTVNEFELRASRLLRKGLTDLDSGLQKMARITEPMLRAKVYASD